MPPAPNPTYSPPPPTRKLCAYALSMTDKLNPRQKITTSTFTKVAWGGQGGRTLNARITNKLLSIVFHNELCWLSSSDAFHVHCMTKGTRKVVT